MCEVDVKNLRLSLGLTQKELADKIGVSVNTIQNYESGRVIPKSKKKLLSEMSNQSRRNIHNTGTISGSVISGDGNAVSCENTEILKAEISRLLDENRELSKALMDAKDKIIKLLEK
jgi:predicted transcriptional regulator